MRAMPVWMGMLCVAVGLMPVDAVQPAGVSPALQLLPDPTRPPLALMPASAAPAASSASSPAGDGQGRAPSGSYDAAMSAPPINALTLVRVDGNTGHGLAVIGGRVVTVGDRVGDAVVISVDTLGVTLRTTRGTKRLSMWNSSNKASSAPTAAVSDSGKDAP